MKFTNNPITITTIDGDARVVRTNGKDVGYVISEVKQAILDMYHDSDVVFEEFIECGELEITGLPLNIQVQIFTELKEEIDGDKIYIESPDGDFPTMKLDDYLILGPTNGDEDFPSEGLYYYGNSMKEAMSNPPVKITTAKQLIQYEANYTFVIAADAVDKKEED